MPDPTAITSTTQVFLDIFDIAGDLVIMKDGSASMILSVDAINFALLAEEEQDSIIYAYAGLLNSLNYPIQILIRSQTKDVSNYLELLAEQEAQATSKLKKDQISQYREFVGNLIQERHVLDKKFYVVIPAAAIELGFVNAKSVIPGVKTEDIGGFERSLILEKAHNNLDPKRDHLIGQFARIGLYARQLATQEIIQLFYLSYNPEAAEGQKITDSSSYTTSVVQARIQGPFLMNDQAPTPPQPMSVPPTAAPAQAIPEPTPVTPPVMPPVAPVAPAMPIPPVTPMPSMTPPAPEPVPVMPQAAPMPPVAPVMPDLAPTTPPASVPEPQPEVMSPPVTPAAAPTPAPAADDAQAMINNTIQQLGGDIPVVTPAAGPVTPIPPITPTMSEPAPMSVPANIPAADSAQTDALPPLPEI